MSKATKPPAHHISAVQDAVRILTQRGVPHYAPDVVRETGLSRAAVNRVLAHLEAQAASNPTGKDRIQVTRMAGQTKDGGIATNDADRDLALAQRDKGIRAQLVHQASRRRTQYLRQPASEKRATAWARAARQIDVAEFVLVRAEIDTAHKKELDALVTSGKLDFATAFNRHFDLMAEIDAL